MSTGKTLLGLLAGAAIGATLGILFAPDKGSETRKKLSKKGVDLADDLKYQFYELVDSFTKKAEKVKEEGKDFVGKAKTKYDEAKSGVKNPGSEMKPANS